MTTEQQLAERIADRLGEIDGVVAVALGGSWARGAALPDSDLDVSIYYDPGRPPAIPALRDLARELDDRHPTEPLTDFGGWGPWINGGGWLTIRGQPVDRLYRDRTLVERTIDDCRAGRSALHHQPSHPHGFHTHIYMGEVHYAIPLYDPDGALVRLKALTTPYPPALKRHLIETHLWQARFALETTRKPAARGDVFHVAGSLFQCVAALVQVLFALNERYWLNEKGAIQAIAAFPLRPDDFAATVSAVLAGPGETPARLAASVARLEAQVRAAEVLCASARDQS